MTAQAREHSITTIVQDPRLGADGTVRVTCTCGELCEQSPSYRTGLGYLVSEELHHQGLTVPEAMARGLLAAVRAHREGRWTAPPPDEAVQRDLARAADRLTSGAAALRRRAEWLRKAASQMEAGGGGASRPQWRARVVTRQRTKRASQRRDLTADRRPAWRGARPGRPHEPIA